MRKKHLTISTDISKLLETDTAENREIARQFKKMAGLNTLLEGYSSSASSSSSVLSASSSSSSSSSSSTDNMVSTISTEQGDLIGLSKSGIQQLIKEIGSQTPDKKRIERLLEGITILNLKNVKVKVTQAGYRLLIKTGCKYPTITSFDFSGTYITYWGIEHGVYKWVDIQYAILFLILEFDNRPIKWLDLSYSNMILEKGSLPMKWIDLGYCRGKVPLDVGAIFSVLIGHKTGSLYLRNHPEYRYLISEDQQPQTEVGDERLSASFAKQLSCLLHEVPVQHLNIEGAGIPIEDIIRALTRCPIESMNLNNNLIKPDSLPSIIKQLAQSTSLRSITMSNMKFIDTILNDTCTLKLVALRESEQESYSRELHRQLASIETVAMKTMQPSKEGSSSSTSSISLSSSFPFVSRPSTIPTMAGLFEYFKKHSRETRTATAKELDNSDDGLSLS